MKLLLSIAVDKKDVVALMEYAVRIARILGQFEWEICVRRMVEISASRYTMARCNIRCRIDHAFPN